MKQITADSIAPATKAWFGNNIQSLAMRHELAGPDIRRVQLEQYRAQIIDELRSRARVAVDARELPLALDQLDTYCCLAAEELIRLRQTRAAHQTGELPRHVLHKLPVYAAFRDYFDEAPTLVLDELTAAMRVMWNSKSEEGRSEPLSEPAHPAHPLSKQTREWLELQVFALACADDAWGGPVGKIRVDVYMTDSALRIRSNARRAMEIGDLHLPQEDVDKMCWVAAGEAFLLRKLKASRAAGETSDQEIRRMPIYGPYKEYFEHGSDFVAMTKRIAAAAGIPLGPSTSS
ncbi:MAG TPA: hypothetical protein VFE51_22380 [Verrucomicrobiae bacterium]|nr:hypothetical protein [Verrucomicrobiae bacterium]